MTKDTSPSQRCVALLTPLSSKPDKTCRSGACYSRRTGSYPAKAQKNERTRAATIANDDSCRLKQTNPKSHQRTRKPTEYREIFREHATHPLVALDAPPKRC
jgi:hypothetical protein